MNTRESKPKSFEIVAGPSRDMLFDACKYAYSKHAHVAVDFAVATGYTMPRANPGCACIQMQISDVKICGIEHEDGSGESFNLHGYCKANLGSFGTTKAVRKPYRFKAYYNARTRKGFITFIE
jgi:hypothetical protein